jgi:hypothetical protein
MAGEAMPSHRSTDLMSITAKTCGEHEEHEGDDILVSGTWIIPPHGARQHGQQHQIIDKQTSGKPGLSMPVTATTMVRTHMRFAPVTTYHPIDRADHKH